MTSEESSSRLSILLFGKLQIDLNGTSLSGKISDKAMCLLAYLVHEFDRPHRREYLAEMFWPGKPPGMGRNNLRQTLAILRLSLGDRGAASPYLHVTRDEIQFNEQSEYFADANTFVRLIEESATHNHEALIKCEACKGRLKRAVDLYQGDFLEAAPSTDCQLFEEWILIQREAHKRKMLKTLERLISLSEKRQAFRDASDCARRLVEIEPWDEENHRLLMRMLAQDGNRSAALKQYEICQKVIFNEFHVETTKETTALYEAIRQGKWNPPNDRHPIIAPSKSEVIDSKESQPTSRKSLTLQVLSVPIWLILGIVTIILASVLLLSGELPIFFQRDEIPTDITEEIISSELVVPTITPSITPIISSAAGYSTDHNVLIALYESTDGENWTVSEGWNSDESHCNWYGVKCAADVVVKLQLPNNKLCGRLPEQIGQLAELAVLDLHDNKLTGGIPPELGRLNKLAELDLSYNHLEGKIPPELGNLENLVVLSVKGNAGLIGIIPPELGNLLSLRTLRLSSYDGGTQLYGWIPPEIGNLTRLTHLEICNSQVSGPIPPEIGNLTGLVFIDLSNNPLSGELPEELGNLTNAVVFFLGEGKNHLRGPLPLSLVNLNKIELFQFHYTDICEPNDPLLQSWLSDVPELYRTGILCEEVEGN
jgi:DNA-binding SARP family transcriptional activator